MDLRCQWRMVGQVRPGPGRQHLRLMRRDVYKRQVSVHLPKDGSGNAKGWRKTWGKGRYVNGADLPKRIYVRWQSLAEPQTYSTIVEIPERARQLMTERLEKRCV